MSVELIWIAEGVEGNDTPESRNHVRAAFVRCGESDSPLTSVTALQVSGIPAYGDAHPSDPGLKVTRKSASNLGNGYEWDIRVEYSYNTQADTPPVSKPWDISQDYVDIEIVPDVMMEVEERGGDELGDADPSVNSAGESFVDPVTETISCNVLLLEKDMPYNSISPSTTESYQGSVNNAQITVAGIVINKRCGLMRRCAVIKRYEQQADGSTPAAYWRLRVEIVIYPANITTDIAVLQQGYNEYTGGGGYKVLRNEDGTEARVPQLLDLDGKKTDIPTYRFFARTKRVSWSGLGLPGSV